MSTYPVSKPNQTHTLPCLTPKPKHKYFVNTYLLGIAFTKWIQE